MDTRGVADGGPVTVYECERSLLSWLGEIRVGRDHDWKRHVAIVYVGDTEVRIGESTLRYDPPALGSRVVARLWTSRNLYQLLATPDYLGCTSQRRSADVGEDWMRGRDLADGDFCRETWDKIARAVLGNEMELLPEPVEAAHT